MKKTLLVLATVLLASNVSFAMYPGETTSHSDAQAQLPDAYKSTAKITGQAYNAAQRDYPGATSAAVGAAAGAATGGAGGAAVGAAAGYLTGRQPTR